MTDGGKPTNAKGKVDADSSSMAATLSAAGNPPVVVVQPPAPASARSASVPLASLAPRYEADQHGTYLGRLEAAAKEPKNLNIALTGRYGVGKSSVLDEFEKSNASTTLRLAISTLGPNEEGATLTNRIQKELVKQLVYSAKQPATLRQSRFSRGVALPRRRAALEASVMTASLGVFLALMGWLPTVAGTGADHRWLVRVLAWGTLAALLIAAMTVVRLVTHDRFVVEKVSAGGATVSLSKPEHTYFDEYLDDIVTYFDNEDVDTVIFEDLDRFDDPHIFEALRELNTLLNKTKKRVETEKPLRFVYAVRDSLFERLGDETDSKHSENVRAGDNGRGTENGDDRARAEVIRANRTKFFDVVIPMVPFISHRNARELLIDLLADAGVTSIDRPLITVVARHSTDMRLLRNICNEYLVFTERLLESGNVAPGLTASNLFALVAYKNFHLGDFENIGRRASDLDRLYDYRRDLVRANIARLEAAKREQIATKHRERTRVALAARLAERIATVTAISKAVSSFSGHRHVSWKVGDQEFSQEDLSHYPFWAALAETGTLEAFAAANPNVSGQRVLRADRDHLRGLVPEAFDAGRWAGIDARRVDATIGEIERAIAFLRGSNFDDLAMASEYKLERIRTADGNLAAPGESAAPGIPGPEGEAVHLTFAQLVDETMESDLARELVNRGYLERNFALYSAQFYGHFTGIDVANFVVQNVQPNSMEVDYEFESPASVASLLEEVDDDFIHTVAAYNIDVLNYLFDNDQSRATVIVDHVADDPNKPEARTFLTAYFTSGTARRRKFAAALASRPWRAVFQHLAENDDVPEDARPELFSAALCAAEDPSDYELTSAVASYIVEHYAEMEAFTGRQDPDVAEVVVKMLDAADVRLPALGILDDELLTRVVAGNHYELSASNLHTAMGHLIPRTDSDGTDDVDEISADLSFDRLRENPDVYDYCLANPESYLTVVEGDPATTHTVHTASVLAHTLNDVIDAVWEADQVSTLVDLTAPTSRLDDINTVPAATWPVLASADRFRASLRNFEAYRAAIGTIDEHLAHLLAQAGEIHASEAADITSADGDELDKVAAACALLNAPVIARTTDRVAYAASIGAPTPLPIDKIEAAPGDLLALLLRNGLVADDADTFLHFHDAGWSAIGLAIKESAQFAEFVTPELVDGMIADVLRDAEASAKVGKLVVTNASAYAPNEDREALSEIGRYAQAHKIALSPDTILRIAVAADGAERKRLVPELLCNAVPAATQQNIVDVFQALGEPYSHVTRPGANFALPYDEEHRFLLEQLGERLKFRKRNMRDLYDVTVL